MTIPKLILLACCLLPFSLAEPQTVVVTDDPAYTVGNASSMLDIKSITKGLLIPRVTLTSSLSSASPVSAPATGLLVYNEGANQPVGFYYWSGSAWTSMGVASSADGSETKINSGTSVNVTGSGTTGAPYVINYATQTVTYAQRVNLTPFTSQMVLCSDCGSSGELQVWNGAAWTNITGGNSSPALPTVTTAAVTPTTKSTAVGGGNVTSNGGATVTASGVCWNTTGTPTTANSKTTDGSGLGSYVSYISGLTDGVTYYVRAYATNSAGTSYGAQTSFTAFGIGSSYQGGILAYIFLFGDPGYIAGQFHGLVATAADISLSEWGCYNSYIGTTATALGTGYSNSNTNATICPQSETASYKTWNLSSGGYTDWYLPSKDELYKLYLYQSSIGGFTSTWYWSSSEYDARTAWAQTFSNGIQTNATKSDYYNVRPVRTF